MENYRWSKEEEGKEDGGINVEEKYKYMKKDCYNKKWGFKQTPVY